LHGIDVIFGCMGLTSSSVAWRWSMLGKASVKAA